MNFAGWTESRRWACKKTCSVSFETAAQSWGGSHSETAVGGWSWTKKRWSSVIMCGKEYFFLSLRWGKLLYVEYNVVFAFQSQSWGGPNTERRREGSKRTYQARISKEKTAANFGGARAWKAQIKAQKTQAKVGPSWRILQWFRDKVFFHT